MSYQACKAETISFRGHDGFQSEAYYARPLKAGRVPGIVVIHHMPGWDEWTTEVARKFAHHGYAAIAPHLFSRYGPGEPDDVAARARPAGGAYDAEVMGDVAACMAFLRAQPNANGKIGVIGFCSGGRHTYLAACTLPGHRRRRRLLGRARDRRRSEGLLAAARGRADRPYRQARLPAARHLRQRRQEPDRRPGQPDRAGAQEARQDLRIPPLRRRRPFVLRLRPARPIGRNRRADAWQKVFAFFDKHLAAQPASRPQPRRTASCAHTSSRKPR